MNRVWSGVRDAFEVIIDGLRLAGRHLPVLATLYLFGAAFRGAIIWLAVNVSDSQPMVARLILPLAPIASLAAIILMLRTLSPSLRWADFGASPGTSPGRRMGQRLGLLASLLIPFLTVYSAQGFLEKDRQTFVNMAAGSEFRERADAFYDFGADRFLVDSNVLLLSVIVVAFVLRRLINHFDLAEKATGMGLVAAYIEIFWMVALAHAAAGLVERFNQWRDSRVFTVWVLDRWHVFVDVLGPVGAPVKAVVDWVAGLLLNGTDLIVVPLAWLTVGAVAYGKRSALEAPDVRLPTPRRFAGRWTSRLDAARQRTSRVPAPIRKIGHNATADVRDRFKSFADGVRLLVVAGFVPMLMFCVAFSVARLAEWGFGEALRALRGPVAASTGIAFEPWFGVLRIGAYTVLLVGLIGAAVDRIVRRREAASEPAAPVAPVTPVPAAATAETAVGAEGAATAEPTPAPGARRPNYEWP